MRILFDQGTPAPLRHELVGQIVSTAYEMDWAELGNGDLLKEAETSFDVFITTDQNLRHEQNLKGRRLAVLVLPTTSWPKIHAQLAKVVAAVDALRPGDFVELRF